MNKQYVPSVHLQFVATIMGTLGFPVWNRESPPTFEVVEVDGTTRGRYYPEDHHLEVDEEFSSTYFHEIVHSLQGLSGGETSLYASKSGGLRTVAYQLEPLEVQAKMVELVIQFDLDAKGIRSLRDTFQCDWIVTYLADIAGGEFVNTLVRRPAWWIRLLVKRHLKKVRRHADKLGRLDDSWAFGKLNELVYQEMGW